MGGRFSKRPRKPNGIYRRCRRGFLGLSSCPGYTTTSNGVVNPHQKCGGDGWIKVGQKGKARKRGKGRRRASAKRWALGGATAWFSAEQMFGVVGRTMVAVVFVLLLGLRLVAEVNSRRAA